MSVYKSKSNGRGSKSMGNKGSSLANGIAKCSRTTLQLLGLVIALYVVFLAVGYMYYRPGINIRDSNAGPLERFQESVDSNVETVKKYRDVFNKATVRSLDEKAEDIRRITVANHAVVDKDLESLQGRIAMLVQQMNANLYRQIQRNYRVANDAAITRAATDVSQLPASGI